jgi:probable addiction module antidote protein
MSQTQTKRQFRRFEDDLRERLADPEYARVFLDVALEEHKQDGDTEAFLLALRDVAEAQGGLTQLAKRTKLNRQNLYKALSSKGNPRLQTVETILHCLGFRLSVEPVKAVEPVKTSE